MFTYKVINPYTGKTAGVVSVATDTARAARVKAGKTIPFARTWAFITVVRVDVPESAQESAQDTAQAIAQESAQESAQERTAANSAVDMRRVSALMRAFAFGGKTDDLGKADDRYASGQYDRVMWHVALDGATLYGFDAQYRANLIKALAEGMEEINAEAYAYETTAIANGFAV